MSTDRLGELDRIGWWLGIAASLMSRDSHPLQDGPHPSRSGTENLIEGAQSSPLDRRT